MGVGNIVVTKENTSNGIKLTVQGRVDSVNAAELGDALEQVVKKRYANIVLNMLRVEYLCSTGIRVILKAYKETKAAGGKFGIEKPSECVKNVLGIVALDEMLIGETA